MGAGIESLLSALRLQWSNGLQNTTFDVGMNFVNVRDYSVKIGNDKKLGMPSGKFRLHSAGGYHNNAR